MVSKLDTSRVLGGYFHSGGTLSDSFVAGWCRSFQMEMKVTRFQQWLPLTLVALAAAAMLVHGPIAKFDHYHEFGGMRSRFAIRNAADVLSNVGFALAGVWGFWALRSRGSALLTDPALRGFSLFFAALLLTSLGSSFYHLAPDNQRLLWDRLPIALACAGLLAAVHAETRDPQQPPWVPITLVAIAIASVFWWSVTESRGAGDLRPYLLLQGAPLVLVPLWQQLGKAPRASRIAFGIAIVLYAVAKAAEVADRTLFDALGFVSGHTLKHLLAVAAGAGNPARPGRHHPAPPRHTFDTLSPPSRSTP